MRPKGSETPQEVQKGKELFKKNSKVEFFFFFFFFFFFVIFLHHFPQRISSCISNHHRNKSTFIEFGRFILVGNTVIFS